MAIQLFNPLLSPTKQFQNPVFLPRRTQLTVTSAASVSLPWEERLPANAVRRKRDPSWRGGFSLGVDLGLSRTGVALSKGFSIRPLTVLPYLQIHMYFNVSCRFTHTRGYVCFFFSTGDYSAVVKWDCCVSNFLYYMYIWDGLVAMLLSGSWIKRAEAWA